MRLRRLLNLEWDAIAGIIAAVVASVLHLLHIVDAQIILPIMLVLIALLFVNFMRHTHHNEVTAEQVDKTAHAVRRIQASLKPPQVILVGPRHLLTENEKFVRHLRGETIWYNLCLSMYQPEHLFDALVRPAIENGMVTSIQFVLDSSQKTLWDSSILPRIKNCPGHTKVREPLWQELEKTVSFILGDSQLSGGTEALLSFWGEPFMAQTTQRKVPRYIFHVQKNSELLPHFEELARSCRHNCM